MTTLENLQNGTDIRGIAMIDGNLAITLTEDAVRKIARGFSIWIKNKYNTNNLKIALGIDSRITGINLKGICSEEILGMDIDVIDCNMATTPAMFMTTIMDNYKADGAIMITASHMPKAYNGMKFFTRDGGLEKFDIKEVIKFAQESLANENGQGKIEIKDLISDYSKILVEKIRNATNTKNPLKNLKIIVDAGNGAGGFFVDKVLEPLGVDTNGSQFLNPDGNFPNHIPNPENKEAMKSISDAVLNNNADLGIIFDTDVDRAAIVDSNGREINKNTLIALISAIVLEENPNSIIVTDSITSEGLKDFISNLGGKHHRFKRGYKNVINESKRLNNIGERSFIAIETSGHAALKENYFLDDGAYLVSKILIKIANLTMQGKKLSSLLEDYKEPKEEVEYRLQINLDDFKEYGKNIIEELEKEAKINDQLVLETPNYEGVKIYIKNTRSWFLVRLSLHEPIIAINIEGEKIGDIDKIIDILKEVLKKFKDIDLNNFK